MLEGLDVDPPTFSLMVAAGKQHNIVLGRKKYEKDCAQDAHKVERENKNASIPEPAVQKSALQSGRKVRKSIDYTKWNSWKIFLSHHQQLTVF